MHQEVSTPLTDITWHVTEMLIGDTLIAVSPSVTSLVTSPGNQFWNDDQYVQGQRHGKTNQKVSANCIQGLARMD